MIGELHLNKIVNKKAIQKVNDLHIHRSIISKDPVLRKKIMQ